MIIEIPDDNSIVKWRYKDNEDWKSVEISDLIKAYETDIETQLLGAELHGIKIGYEEAQKKLLRPTGEWIRTALYGQTCYQCNQCQRYQEYITKFCPLCGAEMKGDKEK